MGVGRRYRLPLRLIQHHFLLWTQRLVCRSSPRRLTFQRSGPGVGTWSPDKRTMLMYCRKGGRFPPLLVVEVIKGRFVQEDGGGIEGVYDEPAYLVFVGIMGFRGWFPAGTGSGQVGNRSFPPCCPLRIWRSWASENGGEGRFGFLLLRQGEVFFSCGTQGCENSG